MFDRWFVYNLSPSFNWAAAGYNDQDLKNFVWELAKEGSVSIIMTLYSSHSFCLHRFVLQLISLAGLHSNAAATGEILSRKFA